MMNPQKPSDDDGPHINTGGGDVIDRDQNVQGDMVRGDKVGGDKVGGDKYETHYHYQRPPADVPFQALPLPAHFVPRPEVTEALKARLLTDNSSTAGILVVSAIHGLGGIGKSTLAAALAHDPKIQQSFKDGILWATLGQQPDLLSLLSGWVQTLGDFDFRPPTVESASTHLRTLLQDKAILLVVDDVWQSEHALLFKVGGPRCQVLITTREAIIARAVNADLYDLDVMKPEQALKLLSRRLGREIKETEQAQATTLAEVVGYLPLALELAAAQVADHIPWEELLADLQAEIAHLETLELPGVEDIIEEALVKRFSLRASFNLSLKRLSEDKRYYFVWLGILPEDIVVTSVMATTLWNINTRQARDMLRYLRDKALLLPATPVQIGEQEWPAYRLHDLLHDLASNLVTTSIPEGLGLSRPKAHIALLERYSRRTQNGLWHTLPDDGYIHAHLIWHMKKTGEIERIHALLQEETDEKYNGWYEAREKIGQTAGFLEDVQQVWQLAEEMFSQHETGINVGLQCRYALITTSFNSLAENLSPDLLVALVKDRVWMPAQGLAYARQMLDPGKRAKSLAGLIPYLSGQVKDDTLHESLKVVREIEDVSGQKQAEAADWLAPQLSETERGKILQEVLESQETLGMDLLLRLAQHLPELQKGKILRKAVGKTKNIRHTRDLVATLAALAPSLPEPLKAEVLKVALDAARGMVFYLYRIEALASLARHLQDPLRSNVLHELIDAVEKIDYPGEQVKVLTKLIPALPEPFRSKALEKALITAQTINSEGYRAELLLGLAPHLPQPLKNEALSKALAATQAIRDTRYRVESLFRLVPHLSQPLKSDISQAILVAVQTIRDEKYRVESLFRLTSYLPQPSRSEVLKEVLVLTWAIRDTDQQAKSLVDLAPYVSEEFLATTLNMIQGNLYGDEWTEALVKLAANLPFNLLTRALKMVRSRKEDQAKAIIGLAPLLTGVLLGEAVAIAKTIETESERVEVLGRLFPFLSKALKHEVTQAAVAVAKKLRSEKVRQKLELQQGESSWQRDFQWTENSQKWKTRIEKFARATHNLPEPLKSEVLREAGDVAEEIKQATKRAEKGARSARDSDWNIVKSTANSGAEQKEVIAEFPESLHHLAHRTRQDLLSYFRSLAPVIAQLGGKEAAIETFRAVQDVGRWWR